ncbi:MAG: hypothetical protein ACLRZ9_01110 [Eubacterium sp.]
MKINLMTWNTQLHEFGNKSFKNKTIRDGIQKLDEQKEVVLKHLQKENSIVVLQEIPYKDNTTWEEHELFKKFNIYFPEDKFKKIYNVSSKGQIKMTMVLAKNGLIERNNDGINNNCCVSFLVNGVDLNILGVHSHNAFELRTWLREKELFRPDIMLGDFNAGNYIKDKNDNEIAVNRQNYLLLMEGYIDICQGLYTHRIFRTHIDHILLENSNKFWDNYSYNNVVVDRTVSLSDHYPIYCEIEN